MKAIKIARNPGPVVTALAGFALGYTLLMPVWAEAGETNPSSGATSISASESRKGAAEQRVTAAPLMTVPDYIDQSVIGGDVMVGASGAMAVNQAAGDMNQQVNVAAVAYNPQGAASAQTGIVLDAKNIRGALPDVATTRIEGGAFTNTSGLLAINQASGFANSQANSTTIAMGVTAEILSDSALAETLPNAAGLVKAGHDQASTREVSVSETAFQNAQGVVQLNQTAGSGNNSANSFGLRLSVEPKP